MFGQNAVCGVCSSWKGVSNLMLLCPFAYLAVDNNYTSILGVGVFKTKIILRTKISYILSSRSPCQIIYIYTL